MRASLIPITAAAACLMALEPLPRPLPPLKGERKRIRKDRSKVKAARKQRHRK